MESIIIYPKSKEQRRVFEDMANALQLPFDVIDAEKNCRETPLNKMKPSDFFGILAEDEGVKFDNHIQQMRGEWERNI